VILAETYPTEFSKDQIISGDSIQTAIEKIPGTVLLVSDSVDDTRAIEGRNYRGVWFNNYYNSE